MICLLVATFASTQLYAQAVYITDVFYVPLRSGDSNKHRIVHRGLKSGTRVELIETSEDGKHSKVKTEGGTEGWLQSHYLTEKPVARLALNTLTRDLRQAQETIAELRSKSAELGRESQKYQQQYSNLSDELIQTKKEIDRIRLISGNSIVIDDKNKELLKQNQKLETEIETLKAYAEKLNESTDQKWFILGAIILFIGMLIGFIAPYMRKNKRYDSSW